METHTRSIPDQGDVVGPLRATPGDHEGYLEALLDPDVWPVDPLGDPPLGARPPVLTGRGALMEFLEEFAVTPAGRRVLHGWFQIELLGDVLQVIAGDPGADPLRLSPRSLAGAFGTDALDDVRGSADDLALLPEMVGAFIPYAHALRGVEGAETAASLAVIEHFGLASAPSSRVLVLRHAVTGIRSWPAGTSLRSPRYLTSHRRIDLVASRERLRAAEVVDLAS
jgi:hypothetical protein